MEISTSSMGSVVVATLTGDLDSRSAPGAQDDLTALLTDHGRLVVDLTAVPYMSSAGLRTMLLLYRQAQRCDCRVALVGLSGELRTVMDSTGFLDFFVVDDSVEACAKTLEQQPAEEEDDGRILH
jgi:anti-sigma B factor antagonist